MKFNIGDKFEKEYIIDFDMGKEFAKVSGDFNSIHLDENAASSSRFGKRIVHGMLIGSFFSAIIGNDFPGDGSIYMGQNLSFRAPVYYENKIKLIVEIIDIIEDKKRIMLSTQCMDENGKILVDGNAMVYREDI